MSKGWAIVVDTGKTLSKVSLWSRDATMLDRRTRPNNHITVDGIARLDVDGIGAFLLDALADMPVQDVEYIVPVSHGAGAVAVRDGTIAVPPLDYEHPLPLDLLAKYRDLRAPFAETGSPALPDGLNLGAQLFWLENLHPGRMVGSTLMPLPQYWAWFLSDEARTEVTSLGCHSDLWNPAQAQFSSLARNMGWDERFAPLARANEVVGTIATRVSETTGLRPHVKVLCGLHDSNAALMAARGFREIADNEAAVLSTGTWFIAMRLAHGTMDPANLPEGRDCLVNVDPFGQPVPSARFMGGREIETLIEIDTRRVDIKPDQPRLLAAVGAVLENGSMVLPTLSPGNGPFPDHPGGWVARPDNWYERRTAACLYAALVTDVSLDLIGSRDRLLVEGRFAEAEVIVRALASLRPDTQVYTANAHNDVSFGALRLIDPALQPKGQLERVAPLPEDIRPYRNAWLTALESSR